MQLVCSNERDYKYWYLILLKGSSNDRKQVVEWFKKSNFQEKYHVFHWLNWGSCLSAAVSSMMLNKYNRIL